MSAHFEHSILITEDGYCILTQKGEWFIWQKKMMS
jgi:methionine aminopeptidase